MNHLQKKASHELWSLNLTQISPTTVTLVTFRSHGQALVTWLGQELKPLWREDQLFEGNLRQAWAETSAMVSSLMPALQMFARDLMCFIPYWDKDPQYVSKARTYNNKKATTALKSNDKLWSSLENIQRDPSSFLTSTNHWNRSFEGQSSDFIITYIFRGSIDLECSISQYSKKLNCPSNISIDQRFRYGFCDDS